MNWIEEIKNYTPYNEQEVKDKEVILSCINSFDNLLTRENTVAHITSSGYIVNKNCDKVLMIYHKLYDSWAWTGGHADGDDDLLYIAVKEAEEETGAKNIKVISPEIISLDVLHVEGHIKRGQYVATHLHLNVAYLLEVDENEPLVVNEEETNGVKWLPIDELDKYCSEEYIIRTVYNKINERAKALLLK